MRHMRVLAAKGGADYRAQKRHMESVNDEDVMDKYYVSS
jgi:hypothetical protein